MPIRQHLSVLCSAALLWGEPAMADDNVTNAPPAVVPKGAVTSHTFTGSHIFPGTVREYSVYVPKQYDPAKPACVHVSQDGACLNEAAVFDQLIHEKAMPVTVGIFVASGRVPVPGNPAAVRGNRSYEYDAMSGDYARFLVDELLPHIAQGAEPEPVDQRQRPIRQRRQQRRDLRVYRGLGTA
jgi:enterochelin esterase-like enzyme